MNWRGLLKEPEVATPKSNIRNNSRTPLRKADSRGFADFADIARVSRPLGDAVVALAQREFKNHAKRLSRIMRPGYLKWTAENQPELYREIGQTYEAFDTAERVESLKAGRVAWHDYRRLMLAWGRLHVRAIRLHRAALRGMAG